MHILILKSFSFFRFYSQWVRQCVLCRKLMLVTSHDHRVRSSISVWTQLCPRLQSVLLNSLCLYKEKMFQATMLSHLFGPILFQLQFLEVHFLPIHRARTHTRTHTRLLYVSSRHGFQHTHWNTQLLVEDDCGEAARGHEMTACVTWKKKKYCNWFVCRPVVDLRTSFNLRQDFCFSHFCHCHNNRTVTELWV